MADIDNDLADAIRKSTGVDPNNGDGEIFGPVLACIAVLLLTFWFGFSVGSPSFETAQYKTLYERAICEGKGLTVGKLENITVCLNPETKAVYKIELPSKKDK